MINIDDLIDELTLEEKVSLLSGFNSWYSNKIERLSIPSIKMSDGPNGVRGDSTSNKTSACFPSPILMGATWNSALMKKVGIALGQEAKDKDVDVLLGPTINIHRHPIGGRHFESYSEDPVLTANLAKNYVKGVQSMKVAACIKHFIANDTEYQRHTVSSNVDERTLREVYLLPFETCIKEGNAKSVMSAYNKLNDIYCSSHKELLIDILKEEWNFDGYVVSDWGAALETIENANGGLDMEMPGPGGTWGEKLIVEIKQGNVDENLVNDKVKRILSIANFSGRFKSPKNEKEKEDNRLDHQKLIRQVASEGMVLLKNQNFLPLKKESINTIAVIGPNAKYSQIIGGGSASLKPHYEVHPLEAIKNFTKDSSVIHYAKGAHTYKYLPKFNKNLFKNTSGFLVEYFEEEINKNNFISSEVLDGNKFWVFDGFAKEIINKSEKPNTIVKFSCEYQPDISGEHEFEVFAIGRSRLKIDDIEIIDNWTNTEPGEAFFSMASKPKRSKQNLIRGQIYKIEIEYHFFGRFPAIQFGCKAPDPHNLLKEAKEVAKKSDVVILIVGTNSDWETEGNDREDIELPANQNQLVEEVLKANKNTLIVINSGAPISMPWLKNSPAVIQSWFGGQEHGNALSDIIFGQVNPSGKLPTTFPVCLEDTPAYDSYPGENLQMDYKEGLLVGYKWYEKKKKAPLFPFGHGLSYTEFNYENLVIEDIKSHNLKCSLNISNIGYMDGYEIIQCYVSYLDNDQNEPVKTLQAFDKVLIKKGETSKVDFILNYRNFSFWNTELKKWDVKKGNYRLLIGSSSEQIHLEEDFSLD
ncbi:MAG: glycosyl hydrolase family 3 [Flavobacteriaceae bacterium]|nr:glycosyl hydrolase family 3 [Flavobacteriaceae bacterium]